MVPFFTGDFTFYKIKSSCDTQKKKSYPFINYESDERRQYHIFGFSKSWAQKSSMGPLCQPLIQILFVCIQLFNTVICSYSITITLIHSALSNYATTANYPQPSSMTFALNQ